MIDENPGRRDQPSPDRTIVAANGAAVAGGSGIFRRLWRCRAGNVLPIMTMALIPLAGLVGGGVDMSRMYLAKSRLQQACDAGSLAGRKVMGTNTWNANNNAANTMALQFFDGNFKDGAYGTTNRSRSFSETGGKVTGTASVTVPMSVMKIFGVASKTVRVACEADMRLPNTDIMFVLDTTGSMSSTLSGDSQSKITVLRQAVKCFYQAVARLDVADAACGGTEPSGGTPGTQIRIGFVPYATNVNVGKLLPTSYFANSWPYQSRQAMYAPNSTTFTGWRYTQVTHNVSGLKNGTVSASNPYGWASSVNLPIGTNGAQKAVAWDGCIEEARPTAQQTSYWPIPARAKDLDIDLVPSQATPDSLWGPALKAAIYTRYQPPASPPNYTTADVVMTAGGGGGGRDYDDDDDDDDDRYGGGNYEDEGSGSGSGIDMPNNSVYFCPREARKLQVWGPSDYQTYVNSLTANGNTYHDIGMIWGARFISPNGIFASENATAPTGAIDRHLIFMTDGQTCTDRMNYTAYGVHLWDKRTTTTVPSQGQHCSNASTTGGALTEQVDARFPALCSSVKAKGITLWVIYFGTTDATTLSRMRTCASTNRFYNATNAASLNTTFATIASQIAQLRLTR
ncbi:MAG TPA: TadE/TadG family type IV pilus assembly protein [Allosphingosinicella sp.]|jgi:Flp pilus assembly protein TadG